ncbi:unnamed protein product, partial [Rhizoctonia solani]
MYTDKPIEPPPAYARGDATFAQIAGDLHKSTDLSPDFKGALNALREFLVSQEKDTLSKNQLRVLRSQAVYALEECARYRNEGGDLSRVLPVITQILTVASGQLAQSPQWDQVVQDPSAIGRLNTTIGDAFDRLAEQIRQIAKGENSESIMYENELRAAREKDRKKIAELESAIRELESSSRTPNEVVQSSMTENLKIIGDSSVYVEQKQVDARRALAVIAELTGKSLPPSTMLDRKFVIMGSQAISQGASYDVFLGEYFTGEKVAIK